MQCRACAKSNLSPIQMKKEKGIATRGICLPCASEIESYRIMRAKVERKPSDYMECNKCDKYFKKNKGGRFYSLRVECPYCWSENIQPIG